MPETLKQTPAKSKLIKHLRKRDKSLNDEMTLSILHNIERFVKVVQKIYTQPQAQIKYKELKRKVDGSKKKTTIKYRIIETDIEELSKVVKKPGESINKVMMKFNKIVTKEKNDK